MAAQGGENPGPPFVGFDAAVTDAAKALFLPYDMNWIARQTFLSYITSTAPIELKMVHGDPRPQPRSSSVASSSTAAVLDWFLDLIMHGFSLDGSLFMAHHFMIDQAGCLKGSSDLHRHVVIATQARTQSDLTRVASMIEDEIYQGVPLPLDVDHLVNYLREPYVAGNAILLGMHSSKETDMGKSELFGRIFNKMEIIKEVDSTKHTTILGNVTPTPNWIANALPNMHLQRILRYKKNKSGLHGTLVALLSNPIDYTLTLGSQLTCRRNGEAHLPKDYCVNKQGLKIALEAAIQTMINYNPVIAQAMNRVPTIAAQGLQALGTAGLLTGAAFSKTVATAIATAIEKALKIPYQSVEIARAAVDAAINAVCSYTPPDDPQALVNAANDAAAAAATALANQYQIPYPLPIALPTDQMFEQDHVDLMFSLVDPEILPQLQRAMHDEGELVGPLWSVARSRMVRLPPVVP